MYFVFSDKTALQSIRFRHFMSDCQPLLAGRAELDSVVSREREALGQYLEEACRNILANFNPKVVADSAREDLF